MTIPAEDAKKARELMARAAKRAGFTGNTCRECGNFQMVRNGTCEKCQCCGATTGCS